MLGPCRISMMELFCRNILRLKFVHYSVDIDRVLNTPLYLTAAFGDHSFCMFAKISIFYSLNRSLINYNKRITCAYQGVRNLSFFGKFFESTK